MPRRFWIVPLLLSIVVAGCGGEEEPTEVPKSPPPGKGLPKFAQAPGLAKHVGALGG